LSAAIKFQLLGTGTSQGVPVIGCDCPVCLSEEPKDHRFRTAAYISDTETHLLIDTGPDLRMQLLRANISNIHGVLMTHEHNDHVAGMDDLRPINFLHRRSIPIYAEKRVCDQLRKSFQYIFDDKYQYPGKPRLTLKEITIEPFMIGSIRVIPIRIMHGHLPIIGFRFGDIAYLTDVKTIPDSELEKLTGLKYLFLSALHHDPHHSHLNLDEALDLIKQIYPKQTFLTHCSHRMGLFEDIEKQLPEHVNLGYDGLLVEI
jgi:phosphoribosyl 1,2-cyclic phosphate phosphodiesterase